MEDFFSLVSRELAEYLGGCDQDTDSVQLGDARTSRIQLLDLASFTFKTGYKNCC